MVILAAVVDVAADDIHNLTAIINVTVNSLNHSAIHSFAVNSFDRSDVASANEVETKPKWPLVA